MPVIIRKTTASLQGVCTVEDAEPLLQWLLAHPGGKVQTKDCVNLHSAVLQTLLVGRAQCLGRPADANLCAWLDAALPHRVVPASE
jgi:hypothetical protein